MNSISERTRRFLRDHPIADLLALNLSHPRFTIADIDLGQRDETSRRGDFPKFRDWGLKVVMCTRPCSALRCSTAFCATSRRTRTR